MKLTKKQLSALQRIVGREQTRYDEIQSEALAGVHPGEKHFAITDGTMVVLFAEQPVIGRKRMINTFRTISRTQTLRWLFRRPLWMIAKRSSVSGEV